MKTEIISIGNEILIGDTVNTNASWLGQILTDNGVEVIGVHSVGDDLGQVKSTLRRSMKQCELVISTGGLGPTHDDLTKKALQELFESGMVVDEDVLNFIKKTFKKRNIPFSQSNYQQAEVPDNAEVLFNEQGTAPGLWFHEMGCRLAVLPGVPHEMKYLMKEKVLPKIRELLTEGRHRFSRYILTAGIGESTLSDEVLGDIVRFLKDGTTVAYLPGPQGTRIRISTYGRSHQEAESKLRPLAEYIYDKAGELVVGEGRELTLSEAVGSLLRQQKLTVATAESCTGGLLASTLTDIPGSSDYTVGGVVAYSNEAKIRELIIRESDLEKFGAVSKQVALQMAKNTATKFGTEIGISATGIAGPSGGTREKPVGTVWIGFWSKDKHFALKPLFTSDRRINKERTVAVALEMVRRTVEDIEIMPYGLEPHWA